jgi:hypothetical protein
VDEALAFFAQHSEAVKNLMGFYLNMLDLVPAAPAV